MITDHTLQVLELDRVLTLIADRTQSAGGRERALRLRPFSEAIVLQRQRALIQESLDLQRSSAGFPSAAHDDLRPVLALARAAGSILEPADLSKVARALKVVREVKTAIEDHPVGGERMRDLAEALAPSRDLERRIGSAVGPSGDILDSASPKLAKLRRQALATRESLRGRLDSFRHNLDLRADGDSYVTFRSGRYVIPVPAGDRGKVRGIIHDQSASGQTLFIEPFVAVEENNALARAEAEAREEERRILADLSERVTECAAALTENGRILSDLDLCRAIALLAADQDMILADLVDDGALRLVRARHPLMLAAMEDRDRVIPLDVELTGGVRILILTGPNMGGKTVALKTIGLSAVMTMSALPVPVDPGTVFPFLRTVAADIGDEQSIAENLSTFASHLKNLQEFLNEKEDPALVLLDELGTGTDPSEGGALARAYLEALDGPGTRILATTHLTQLKDFAADHPAAVNGSMAFDEASLSPLFTLDLGTPGRSRAFEVAARLAFPDAVLDRARALVSQEEREMDRLLAQVETARERLRQEEARARQRSEETEARLREAKEREQKAREVFQSARARAAQETDAMLREAQSLVKDTRKKLAESGPSPSEVEKAGRQIREKQKQAEVHRPPPVEIGTDYPEVSKEEIVPGFKVWSLDLGSVVTADETPSSRGMVHVTKSGIRFAVSVQRLRQVPRQRKAEAPKPKPASGGVTTDVASADSVSPELDLRGMTGAEATTAVESYLDTALLTGLGLVRIIHGKGTGVLRKRVAEVLKQHQGVERFRFGEPHEGGDGVTIAQLGER